MTPRSRTFARRQRVRAGRTSRAQAQKPGVSSIRSRACELFWLQKSTSGVWRQALAGDESAKAAVSSLPFAGGEEASEARPGWQNPLVRVAGSRSRRRESGAERALVGGRHPEPGKVVAFDEVAVEAVLVASRRGFGPGRVRRQGMSEGDSHSPSAAENAVAEVRRTRVLRSEEPPGMCDARGCSARSGTSSAGHPKLSAQRQLRLHSSRTLGPWLRRT